MMGGQLSDSVNVTVTSFLVVNSELIIKLVKSAKQLVLRVIQ